MPLAEPKMNSIEIWIRFLFSIRVIIDVLAVVPAYVILGLDEAHDHERHSSLTFFRILRLFRLIRIFSMTRKIRKMNALVIKVMMDSLDALGILLLYLIILCTFFGSCLYFVEMGSYNISDVCSNFDTCPECGCWLRVSYTGKFKSYQETPFTGLLYILISSCSNK